METATRTMAKAVTWQLCGLVMMSIIGYVMTGSLVAAGGYALLTSAIGFGSYFLHERVWSRVGWGLRQAEGALRAPR